MINENEVKVKHMILEYLLDHPEIKKFDDIPGAVKSSLNENYNLSPKIIKKLYKTIIKEIKNDGSI